MEAEKEALRAERARVFSQLKMLVQTGDPSQQQTIQALEKRLTQITKSLRTPMSVMKDQKYRARKKVRTQTYLDPFLSDVDLFYMLTENLPTRTAAARLSPTVLREFGWRK